MTISKLVRLSCSSMLNDMLPDYTDAQCEQIEMSLFTKNPLNTEEYIRNAKRICHNIAFLPKSHVLKYLSNDETHPTMAQYTMTKCKIQPTTIAFISDENMRGPVLQKVMDDEREQYDISLKMLYDKVEEGSVASMKQKAAITCNKCGSSEILMAMAQTRSADEGTTMFFRCVKCNQKWKVQ